MFKGFTENLALELFEICKVFGLRSARTFAVLPDDLPLWRQIEALRTVHLALPEEIEQRDHGFSGLESRFRRLVNSIAPNRFIDSFYDIVTMIDLACRAHLATAKEPLIRSTSGRDVVVGKERQRKSSTASGRRPEYSSSTMTPKMKQHSRYIAVMPVSSGSPNHNWLRGFFLPNCHLWRPHLM